MKSVAKLMAIAAIVILLSAGAYALWTRRTSEAGAGCCEDSADCCDDSAN